MVFDSLIKGFVLAGFSYSIGMIMDITISRNSWCEMIEEIPELYNSAIRKNTTKHVSYFPVIILRRRSNAD